MTIAFIGAGNMAISLIRGLLETGTAPTTIIAADPSQEQRTKAANLGIKTS
ncbi:MAG: NAD(P)-binding domain-containing protein, partial [Pseudomonadota bacterium]|nr:NAD(P)-binding domain-containing protein [Pseudomonadota bacterium]